MSTIKKVTIAGASGSLGTKVLEKLIAAGKFNIRVLSRKGSATTFPSGVEVAHVDYSSYQSLKAALQGQDAIISTLSTLSIGNQLLLIDAAIDAGVQRIIPSEFGSNLDNPNTRTLPVFAEKVKVQDYIIEKSKHANFTYTLIYNGAFLDWGLEKDFLLRLSSSAPTIVEGGDNPFSATTTTSIADAVVGILDHLKETANRTVFIRDIVTTQNQLLGLARKVAPSRVWSPEYVKLDDLTNAADARLAKGLYDTETFVPYLFRAVLDPAYGGNFPKTDNELLGVKEKTDEDIIEILKPLLE